MNAVVRIRGIAAGGDGVGSLDDGLTVFVPRTAPGETVEVTVVRRRRSYARARLARVLEPSAERVEPRCPHYAGDDCGGCQLQHLGSWAQRSARAAIVADALGRIGGAAVAVEPPDPAADEWEYRSRVTLAARGGRIGFHRHGRPGDVFELVRCHIARPEIQELWTALRQCRRLFPPALESVMLRIDRSGRRHCFLKSAGERAWTRAPELARSLAAAGVPVVLWWAPERGAPRVMAGPAESPAALVFEQVHPAMGDRARRHAVDALGPVSGRTVWDLYAGIGETTGLLLDQGAAVESVEVDARAVAEAERRSVAGRARRHTGRVEDLLDRLGAADAVIANPPRTGLAPEVTGRFAAQPPERLVYVSCDPATLARDASRLASSHRLDSVTLFDLFPQTAHVETVARFERR